MRGCGRPDHRHLVPIAITPLRTTHDRCCTIDGRQAGPGHGRRQRPLDRLGHRQGRATSTAPSSPSPTRARRWRSGCGRWPSRSAPRSSLPCDVTDDGQHRRDLRRDRRSSGAASISSSMPSPSPTRTSCKGRYLDTSPRELPAHHECRCYSFTAVAQRAVPLMTNGGSLLTLTYYGAERVMPHYNVMGVAKAALEASVRYLAADLGEQKHPRQRDLRRADQDAGRLRHRRFPLHPEVERAQLAAEAQRHASRRSAAPALYLLSRPRHRRDRRGACTSTAAITSSA